MRTPCAGTVVRYSLGSSSLVLEGVESHAHA